MAYSGASSVRRVLETAKSKLFEGERRILGRVALADVSPGTCPNASEPSSGSSCELNSLPTKEAQPRLLAAQVKNLSKAKSPKKLKSSQQKMNSEEGRVGKNDRWLFLDGKPVTSLRGLADDPQSLIRKLMPLV